MVILNLRVYSKIMTKLFNVKSVKQIIYPTVFIVYKNVIKIKKIMWPVNYVKQGTDYLKKNV